MNRFLLCFAGPSLEDLFAYCHRKFDLRTILLLTDQLLQRLEYCHSKGVVLRDVKPANFVLGMGRQSQVIASNKAVAKLNALK